MSDSRGDTTRGRTTWGSWAPSDLQRHTKAPGKRVSRPQESPRSLPGVKDVDPPNAVCSTKNPSAYRFHFHAKGRFSRTVQGQTHHLRIL